MAVDAMGGHVLDASALLAVLQEEPGAERVLPVLDGAVISSVNWAEVVQKAAARGVAVDPRTRLDVEAVGVTIVPFAPEHAEEAALVWVAAPRSGLSLGDRACLGLARCRGAVAMTTDRAWADLPLGVSIEVVR
jgi:PIN domain nuclease of toxin-antitoxin system